MFLQRLRSRAGLTQELADHPDDGLHDRMALDEDHPDDVALVARNQDSVIADQHAHGGLVRDLAELDRFHDDGLPAVVANPRRLAALRLLRSHVEDSHDAVVT